MTALFCARCGDLVARVDEARFPVLPSESLCRACSFPAYVPPPPPAPRDKRLRPRSGRGERAAVSRGRRGDD